MNKVVSINLNGRVYSLEEAGYDALRKYLETAATELAGSPDKNEVMADFEQAVADKCDQYLGKGKTVVSAKELTKIIKDMGPVKLETDTESADQRDPAPRRLYLIKEGSIIAGVATGLAAYFNLDVTVIRLALIILTFVTSGAMILVYLALMLLVPTATTPEEKAAARGQNFNASDLLDRAKAKYGDLTDKDHWQSVADQGRPALNNVGAAILKILRLAAGLIAACGSLILVALLAAWIATLWSVILTGLVFGYTIDPSLSSWMLGLFVTSGFFVVVLPILVVTVSSWRYARHSSGKGNLWVQVTSLGLLAIAMGIFLAITSTSPQIRTLIQDRQGHLNFGHRTVCVGDDTYCHRIPVPDPKVPTEMVPITPVQPVPPMPVQ